MRLLSRRAWLASSVLLLCAAGSCYVGDRQEREEVAEYSRWLDATGSTESFLHGSHTNVWQTAGVWLLFLGVSVAVGAFILWRRESD